ncbi:MAG: S1 RNA-binding domain-containing protein [Christensenellales bacterium]
MCIEVGNVVEGVVTGLTKFGAFVQLPGNKTGMVHISEVSKEFVQDINQVLKMGDVVKVRVIHVEDNKIGLSIRKAEAPSPRKAEPAAPTKEQSGDFEDLLARFMKTSEAHQSELRRNSKNKRGNSRTK